jgi:non-heme Fe2+,alpha-ketoglutarate-dependent halogenase
MLTQEQQDSFQQNGCLAPLRVVDPAAADRYRALFDELEGREGRERARIGLLDRHFDVPFLGEIATHPVILDAVTTLIGPDVALLATHFFCKYGREEGFVAWHQDVTYWGLEPPQALTVWYAVDDSDAANGCMRAIPGTHHGGIREHGRAATEGNLLSVNQEAPVNAEEEAGAIDLPLHAGEASLHDGMLIHGSRPNRSDRRRCGLTLRYIPAHARQVVDNSVGKRWRPVLVSGQDRGAGYDRWGAAREEEASKL